MSNLVDNIEIKSTDLEPCLKELQYTINAETIKTETGKVVKEFSQFADLPGFRKGKVPDNLIKTKFKDKINEELLQRFFTTAFEKTNKDDSIDIITYTMDEKEEPVIKSGSDFSFTIKYDIAPEISLPEYENIDLVKDSSILQNWFMS